MLFRFDSISLLAGQNTAMWTGYSVKVWRTRLSPGTFLPTGLQAEDIVPPMGVQAEDMRPTGSGEIGRLEPEVLFHALSFRRIMTRIQDSRDLFFFYQPARGQQQQPCLDVGSENLSTVLRRDSWLLTMDCSLNRTLFCHSLSGRFLASDP